MQATIDICVEISVSCAMILAPGIDVDLWVLSEGIATEAPDDSGEVPDSRNTTEGVSTTLRSLGSGFSPLYSSRSPPLQAFACGSCFAQPRRIGKRGRYSSPYRWRRAH